MAMPNEYMLIGFKYRCILHCRNTHIKTVLHSGNQKPTFQPNLLKLCKKVAFNILTESLNNHGALKALLLNVYVPKKFDFEFVLLAKVLILLNLHPLWATITFLYEYAREYVCISDIAFGETFD